jgi:hypothetical protein
MGISFPKLPLGKLFSKFDSDSTASGLILPKKKLHLKKPQTDIVPPPEWVERIEGYFVTSCTWHDSGRFGGCFVVEYNPNNYLGDWDWGFVKIYAAGGMNETPFAQMKGIWKDIYEDKKRHNISYDITEDGKIHSDTGVFPSDDDIRNAIYDIGGMYNDWKDFPNVQDWDVVCKLRDAKVAVDQMRVETKHGFTQKNIDNLRKKIKEIQTQIAGAEKSLNEMYEKAADGMNLLEQYGIAVNLDDEPPEPEKIEGNCDFASMYPTSMLNYSGEATIVQMSDYSYKVTPKGLKHRPTAGDMVRDNGNGLTAVYSSGKWEVVHP